MFPNPPAQASFTKLRNPRNTTKEFVRKEPALGFGGLRLHDLRGAHETILLDMVCLCMLSRRGVGTSGATAELRKADEEKADTGAAAVISALSKVRYIVNWVQLGSKAVAVAKMF